MIVVILPGVAAAPGRPFDLLEYLRSAAAEGAHTFDARRIAWQAGNLAIPGLLPWDIAHVLTPVAGRPDLQIPALIGLALLVLLATVTVRRRQVYWDLYRKLGVLMALFVVFQSPVLVFHPQELSATGFYYGAIFSVLFAPLVASVFADMGEPRRALATTTARLGLLWVLVISAVNFQAINDSWTAHSNAKALDYLPELPIYGHGADVGALARHAAWYRHRNGQLPADAIEASYSPDVTTGAVTPRADTLAIWRNWRRGDADFLAGRPLTIRTLWIAVELDRKMGPTIGTTTSGY